MSTATAELTQQGTAGIVYGALSKDFGRMIPVASYHYMPLNERRDYKTRTDSGYKTVYHLDACPDNDGPPEMLIVTDGYQRVFQGTNDYGIKTTSNEPESAINIANDLVNAATGAKHSDATYHGAAVWIVQAQNFPKTKAEWDLWGTPEFEKRFPEFKLECDAYRKRGYRYAERKVADADTSHTNNLPTQINEVNRLAAKWIGANEAEHPWIKATKFGDRIPCPFCGKPTSPAHPKCETCGDIINYALYEERKRAAGIPATAPAAPAAPEAMNTVMGMQVPAKPPTKQ